MHVYICVYMFLYCTNMYKLIQKDNDTETSALIDLGHLTAAQISKICSWLPFDKTWPPADFSEKFGWNFFKLLPPCPVWSAMFLAGCSPGRFHMAHHGTRCSSRFLAAEARVQRTRLWANAYQCCLQPGGGTRQRKHQENHKETSSGPKPISIKLWCYSILSKGSISSILSQYFVTNGEVCLMVTQGWNLLCHFASAVKPEPSEESERCKICVKRSKVSINSPAVPSCTNLCI